MLTVPEKRLQSYLIGGLAYSATNWRKTPHFLERALFWYRTLAGQGHYHLPFFLVVDFGLLLEHGFETPFSSEQDYNSWGEEERAIRLRYENEILGRLLQENALQNALEMLQWQEHQAERHQRLLELLFRSFAPLYPRVAITNPAHLRIIQPSMLRTSEEERQKHIDQFLDFAQQPNFFLDSLQTFLDQTARTLHWSQLLQEEDLFELQHWEVLDTEELRIGCRQILEVERKLGELDPRQVAIADEGADVETAFMDETHYPTGGLAELTNRGSFENLVLSELIYMESGPDIDLFEVRFVEDELLFYLRDAGQLSRKRRTVHLIIDLEETFQLKSSGYDVQFSTLAQGMLLRISRDLLKIFENDALQFHFYYLHRNLDPKPFARELNLMRLLLADEVQHGWVTLELKSRLDPETLTRKDRKVYAITFSAKHGHSWKEQFAQMSHQRPSVLGVCLHVESMHEHAHSAPHQHAFPLPMEGIPMSEIVDLKDKIVAHLAGLRSG